jgi:hypothetical protein
LSCVNHTNQNDLELCDFSHNQFEIEYHYLSLKTYYCKVEGCNKEFCPDAHGYDEFRYLPDLIITFSHIKSDLNKLRSDLLKSKYFKNLIAEITNLRLPQSFKLSTYKVMKCPLGESCYVDYHYCYNYHNDKERRRNPKFIITEKNEYCPTLKNDRNLLDPSKCPKGDFCGYLHTRNELNYSENNFGKLVDCQRNKARPCEFIEVCYARHYDEKGRLLNKKDLKVEEDYSYLKKENLDLKSEVERKISENAQSEKQVEEYLHKFQIIRCNTTECVTIFSSTLVCLGCKHYFCPNCFKEIQKVKCCFKCGAIIEKKWEIQLDKLC